MVKPERTVAGAVARLPVLFMDKESHLILMAERRCDMWWIATIFQSVISDQTRLDHAHFESREEVMPWFRRMVVERPWETRQ